MTDAAGPAIGELTYLYIGDLTWAFADLIEFGDAPTSPFSIRSQGVRT